MMIKPVFSIIIPVRVKTDYLKETLKHLSYQSFKNFEILVITDRISLTPNPAKKKKPWRQNGQRKISCFLRR